MPQFLRKLSKAKQWAQDEVRPPWPANDCPHWVFSDIVVTGGVSIWKVERPEDAGRILAACALMETDVRGGAYVLLEEAEIRALGVELKNTKGSAVDNVTQDMHRDLVNIGGQKFIELSHLIMAKIRAKQIIYYDRATVLEYIKEYIGRNQFSREAIYVAQKKKDFELLGLLYKEFHI